MAVTETKSWIGESVLRKEDRKLLTGRGTFVDNMQLAGTLYMVVARSPYAHARVVDVDVTAAREAEGVVAAFGGAALMENWKSSLPTAWLPTEDTASPPHYPLATDKVRYAGDGVAVVLAESRAAAKDAAELVHVQYEPLPAVVDPEAALAADAPLVHDDLGTNRCYTWTLANGEVDQLFTNAAHTVKCRFRQQRLIPSALEPRACVAAPTPGTDELTLWSTTQIPHILRVMSTVVLGIPETKIRVIAPDVGGGFGSKVDVYAEEMLVLALARKLGRPVKWTEERSEGFLSTIHGRDQWQEIELAADAVGKVKAVRVRLTAAMGAYLQLVTAGVPLLGAWLYAGCYDVDAYSLECTGVFTHTTPTDAYRGAGRPEATYAIERAMDTLAAELDLDPAELRRRNFITEFPANIASGLTIDAGDYDATLERALETVEYDDLRREQAERRQRGDGKQLGIGLSTYNEMCGLAPSRILAAIRYSAGGWDAATIRFLPTGTVQAIVGTSPHGQAHETTFAQIVADRFGCTPDEVEVLHGDTSVSTLGMDTYGSRSLAVGGIALYNAAERVVEKARKIAAHQLEVDEDDVEYASGTFTVKGTGREKALKEVAFEAWTAHNLPDGLEPGLEERYVYDPPNFSWPAGAHIAIVEVDTETGAVELQRYVAVDDVGTVVNPMVVNGQVAGGVAQGIGQALWEEAVYDDDGQLLTSSLANYGFPSAAELPTFEIDGTVTPSPTNPLGVKGVGETGAIASTAAVMNAVVDALEPFGVTDVQMPATPEHVWRAIEEARR
jgi:aerobic carbon-monoxide dehydrogenase large subunit